MGKKIEWSEASLRDRVDIYRYWLDRNKSDLYSKRLELMFEEALRLIALFPKTGTETDFENLRVKVVKYFKIYYFDCNDVIQVVRIWDTRRNPNSFSVS